VTKAAIPGGYAQGGSYLKSEPQVFLAFNSSPPSPSSPSAIKQRLSLWLLLDPKRFADVLQGQRIYRYDGSFLRVCGLKAW
jgi:hypothetical protein